MPRTTVGLAELADTPHFLYRLYDRTDTLLYIGITNDPKARFKWHRKNQPWWCDVDQSKTRIDFHATRDSALSAETKAIKAENPLYNDQHNLTVDTPQSFAADAAVRDFADLLLHQMTAGRRGYEKALQEADLAIAKAAEDPEEYDTYSNDRHRQAAIQTAVSSTTSMLRLRRAMDLLLELLPEAQVKRCSEEAKEYLSHFDGDEEPDEDELREETASHIAFELAADYLDTLPHIEAAGWRVAARGFLPAGSTDYEVDFHAARFAKAEKAKRRYRLAEELCVQQEWHKARCGEQARTLAHLADCRYCEAETCTGHLIWCEKHLAEAQGGGKCWFDTNAAIVVTRTSEPVEEDPWKVPF